MISKASILQRLRVKTGTVPEVLPPPPPVDLTLPSLTIPLRTFRPVITQTELDYTIRRGLALPDNSKAWIMRRSLAYWQGPGRSWTAEEQDYAACSDYFRYAKTLSH